MHGLNFRFCRQINIDRGPIWLKKKRVRKSNPLEMFALCQEICQSKMPGNNLIRVSKNTLPDMTTGKSLYFVFWGGSNRGYDFSPNILSLYDWLGSPFQDKKKTKRDMRVSSLFFLFILFESIFMAAAFCLWCLLLFFVWSPFVCHSLTFIEFSLRSFRSWFHNIALLCFSFVSSLEGSTILMACLALLLVEGWSSDCLLGRQQVVGLRSVYLSAALWHQRVCGKDMSSR